jgi:hypothetical protein
MRAKADFKRFKSPETKDLFFDANIDYDKIVSMIPSNLGIQAQTVSEPLSLNSPLMPKQPSRKKSNLSEFFFSQSALQGADRPLLDD